MKDVLELVRSGRLQEATDAIRRGLGSGRADGAAPPMRDVTPKPKALTAPPGAATAEARPRAAPHVRAKPIGKARWERRAGALPYRLYRPAEPRAGAPLVVMLHGCTQTPEDFAEGTRMNLAAERIGAHVIWPEQTRAANPNGCWTWFEAAHQGGGEAGAIASIAAAVGAEVAPGRSGIHVAGLSAGGAMAAILGARHGDVFASVGVHSGLAAGAARDVGSAFAAMRSGAPGRMPLSVPAIVFHGTADRTVAPANGGLVAGLTGAAPGRTVEAGRRTATVRRGAGAGGHAVELWEVAGLGHAWSGGSAAGSHADPEGPDATSEMLRFFREVDGAA
ncbi:hypothetical protein JQC91_04375 [Jannaschia sp. Os4]|nr:hypothetical protein [Jannaschia sp. Os4]